MTHPHPFYVTGFVLNVCGLSDDGKHAEMYIMKTATELGTNTYSGLTCTGKSTYSQHFDFNMMSGCNPAGPGYSFKGFKSTTSALLQKYSSVNGIIALNYATKTCSGQYPTIDISIMDPCVPYTSSRTNQTTAGYLTRTLIPTGVTQDLYDVANSNCTGRPVMSYNVTNADMGYGNICTASDDPTDNYKFNIHTTHFLMH